MSFYAVYYRTWTQKTWGNFLLPSLIFFSLFEIFSYLQWLKQDLYQNIKQDLYQNDIKQDLYQNDIEEVMRRDKVKEFCKSNSTYTYKYHHIHICIIN